MPKNARKRRLDLLMLDRGLAGSRERAQALIMEGRVYSKGQQVTKPGLSIRTDTPLTVSEEAPYVSRGGVKLAHALDRFGIAPLGLAVLDVGASTGGFTDCLLQRGVDKVYALDVGHGQLDYRLRQNPRVQVMEGVNAHYPFRLPEKVALATIDVSFISLTKVIPNVLEHLLKSGLILSLVKPQFEAKRSEVGKKGVIKDPRVHARVLGRIILWAINSGLRLRDLTPSPILGAAGNREFCLLLESEEYGPS